MVTITVAHQVEVWGGRAMLGVIITPMEIYCNTFLFSMFYIISSFKHHQNCICRYLISVIFDHLISETLISELSSYLDIFQMRTQEVSQNSRQMTQILLLRDKNQRLTLDSVHSLTENRWSKIGEHNIMLSVVFFKIHFYYRLGQIELVFSNLYIEDVFLFLLCD